MSSDELASIYKEYWYRGRQHVAILNDAQKKIQEVYEKGLDPTFVVECSRQLGKTFWGCFIADKAARENPGAQIRLATAFQIDIEPIVIPNYKTVLSTCPRELRPHERRNKWIYDNGSQVLLVGIDRNPDKLRGTRIRLSIIEEAGFVDSDTLRYLLDSVIAGAQLRELKARTVLISTPPIEGQDHTFCEVADLMKVRGSYIKLTIDESGLPKEAVDLFAKKLGGRHTVAFRREGLCERIVDAERKIVREWEDRFINDPVVDEYHSYYHRLCAMDMGRKDHTALVFGYYDFKKATLYCEDELTMQGEEWTTVTLKDAILKKEKELWGDLKPFRRIADNNNPHLIMDLNALHKVHFIETDKESLEAMVNDLRVLIGEGRVVVSPKCKLLIGNLQYGIWDKNRKEFARSKVYGHFDLLAALMYLVRNLPRHSNPIPDHHGVTHRQFGVNQKHGSNTTKVLEKALLQKRKRVSV
jgi:hypothetical protein